MCGRYVLYEVDQLKELFNVEGLRDLEPNYNTAPTHLMPVYSADGLTRMRWGFLPPWAKDEKLGYKLFNTRSESAFEKPMWKAAIKKSRCLIPANGFYEWMKTEEGKIPYYIHFPDDELFSFAGIKSTWRNDNKEIDTYSILTTTPNKEMAKLHDRMPVIIHKEDYDMWLRADSEEEVKALLTPLADDSLTMYEVSKDVNTVRTNDKDLMYPINSQ